MQQAIRVAMLDAGGYNVDNMWGPPWDPAWKRNDPVRQVARIVANGTRLWIYCAPGGGPLDENVDPGQSFNANSLESMAIRSNKDSRKPNHGRWQQRHVPVPAAGNHSWPYWGGAIAGPQARPDRHPQRLRAATRRTAAEERYHITGVVDYTGTRPSVDSDPGAAYERWDR